jgi:hypothetical protein
VQFVMKGGTVYKADGKDSGAGGIVDAGGH